jgi:uncharacterized membrane protein
MAAFKQTMTPYSCLLAYFTALAIFAVVDFGWLVTMGPRLFRPTLGDILLVEINLAPAIAFYLLYPVALVIFGVAPAARTGELTTALMYGALFGFFAYATYDLTNAASLRNWTFTLAAIDIAWGTFLSSVTTGVAWWLMSRFGENGT